ncbi:transcriptional antiterminator [Clostridium beijerinckii]|uniref:PRD domain-containing protein n=1 Tax=Clostridium beijerinckii TaxID=1520 RepID=UPI002415405B|nr:PRD domain-containing protein [Clostridium beijerinckii]NRZ43451.1 transcriptional antiterminator [Clostridium beijerinckii]
MKGLLLILKFFSQRIFRGNEIEDEDTSLSQIMREKYKEAYKCAEKIKKYVKSEFNSELTDEEMMYLAVHINRVTKQTE